MLSRTADHLYWMSRYMERAENIARFLDVANRQSLSGSGNDAQVWQPVLTIAGGLQAYAAACGPVGALGVVGWAVLGEANPSSILGCLRGARENAHAVRSVIPNELWEAINATWLEARGLDGAGLRRQGLDGFCDWVKQRSHLTRGVTYGTMLRDEPFHFLRLGTFLERADNTARLLGVRAAGVTGEHRAADAVEALHWGAVLRSVGALKAYRTQTRGDITPAGAAGMLILAAEMPRSLHACLDMVTQILASLGGTCECARLAGATHAQLHWGRLDLVLADGLEAFTDRFLAANNALGAQIHADFMMTA